MNSKKLLAVVSLLLGGLLFSGCGDGSSNPFPISITDSRVEAGEKVYADNCTVCHGPVNGPVAVPSAPIHSEEGHTWHHPDRLLFGYVMDRPTLEGLMPAFRGKLSDDEVLAVIAYIKSHWAADIQERHKEGSRQYEAQVIEFGLE